MISGWIDADFPLDSAWMLTGPWTISELSHDGYFEIRGVSEDLDAITVVLQTADYGRFDTVLYPQESIVWQISWKHDAVPYENLASELDTGLWDTGVEDTGDTG